MKVLVEYVWLDLIISMCFKLDWHNVYIYIFYKLDEVAVINCKFRQEKVCF